MMRKSGLRIGTLNYNTLLQLTLFLRREGKWEEVSYTDTFFTSQNHPAKGMWYKSSPTGCPGVGIRKG